MMPIGFENAYGLAGLDQLLAQRKAEAMAAEQKQYDRQRQAAADALAQRHAALLERGQTLSETQHQASQDSLNQDRLARQQEHQIENAVPTAVPASEGYGVLQDQVQPGLGRGVLRTAPSPELLQPAGMTAGGTKYQMAELAARERASQAAQTAADKATEAATARQSQQEFQSGQAQLNRENARTIAGIAHPAKEAPGPVGLESDVRQSTKGTKWVDASKYKGKDYSAAQQEAHAKGIKFLSTTEADAMQNLETARDNMNKIEGSMGKLPQTSVGRLVGGPANKAAAYFQTDPDLAAWGAYRTAAIQAMRAMAGSKGLRINRSEIEAAMANDIPNITDTQATAKQKVQRVRSMLDSQEHGLVGMNDPGDSGGSSAAIPEYVRDPKTGKLVLK